MTDCKHEHLRVWRLLSTAEPVELWSCVNCGRRFEPVRELIGDERIDALAHEIWAAAQLVPGEGIVDGVDRIAAILKGNGNG